ncbi:MAG: DUF1275 domain-containing protein [Cyclobacteriaceae bacterium]|nr:DUF1275 domain-containing protein [Cyclobacteriaceae bacterium]
MLHKYSNNRTLADNMRLGSLTSFTAGMINVASFIIFLSFSSNVTGYFAIFAAELVRANYYQVLVVASWIFLFFFGSFFANLFVVHLSEWNRYWAHALPLLLEIFCLAAVGVYGQYFYKETLVETEYLLSLMLFAMGLQNGLTASISNFSVKTTHLTGATTDLGILFSMFTKKQFWNNIELRNKAKLILTIVISYLSGAVVAASTYRYFQFKLFFVVCFILVVVLVYDLYTIKILKYLDVAKRRKAVHTAEKLIAENS